MEIVRTTAADCIRLTLAGRFDAAWSNHVQEALSECVRGGQHVIELDLSQVVFLSSAGIRVLLLTYRQLHAIDGRLSVVDASAEVRQVIELAGLRAVLAAVDSAPAAAVASGPQHRDWAGMACEVHTLNAQARIAVRAVGDPSALLQHGALDAPLVRASFPIDRLAVGVGAFGGAPDDRQRLGEVLAVGGAAVTLPTSGEGTPDWVLAEAQLVPEAFFAYGLIGEGRFASLVRFEAGAAGGATLETLAAAALDVAAADAVAIALVGEAVELVGAALRRSPYGRDGGVFSFPAIRDQLDFTAEPSHAGTVALIAGFAARRPSAALAAQLRPLDRDGAIAGHLHAAVFPYRPIRRGRIELDDTVRGLFDAQRVLGLLHLVHDWRPGSGAGQTRLHRGALWCAPVVPEATR